LDKQVPQPSPKIGFLETPMNKPFKAKRDDVGLAPQQ